MSKMRIDFEFGTDIGKPPTDDRLCSLESVKESEDPRFPEVLARCACGRTTDFYAVEVEGYIFVCNGGVILKYRRESARTFNFNPDTPRWVAHRKVEPELPRKENPPCHIPVLRADKGGK